MFFCSNISKLPTMHELDRPPSLEELQKAIDSLACNKAPGKDGIPPEVIKISKNNTLVNHLHVLLCQCWDEGTIPQDMRDANPYIKTRVTEATATITVAYHYSALLVRPSHECFWRDCNYLQTISTPNLSAGSEPRDQPLTWSFHFGNSRKGAKNRDNHCSLPLSTWPKISTLLAGVASLHYFKELDALLNSSKWSGPFTTTCKAQSSTMAHHLTPSQSTVG